MNAISCKLKKTMSLLCIWLHCPPHAPHFLRLPPLLPIASAHSFGCRSLEGQKLASFTGVGAFVARAFEDALEGILHKRTVDMLLDIRKAQVGRVQLSLVTHVPHTRTCAASGVRGREFSAVHLELGWEHGGHGRGGNSHA